MQKNYIDRQDWNYKYIGGSLTKLDYRIIYNTWKIIKEIKINTDYENIEILLRYYLKELGNIIKDGEYVEWVNMNNGKLFPKFANYKMDNFINFTSTISVI